MTAVYDQQSQWLLTPNHFHVFARYMLHEDSLLKDIAKALATKKLASDINIRLNNPSKDRKRA